MKKIYSREQLEELRNYPRQVINSIYETIEILDGNYGVNRNVDKDLGGYILILEGLGEIKKLMEDKLKGLIPEYTDVIEVSNGTNYTLSLYLLSCDFSIVVVTTEELSKFLLE